MIEKSILNKEDRSLIPESVRRFIENEKKYNLTKQNKEDLKDYFKKWDLLIKELKLK